MSSDPTLSMFTNRRKTKAKNILSIVNSVEACTDPEEAERRKYRNIDIPRRPINLTFSVDCDIFAIDRIVRAKIYRDIDEIPVIREKMDGLKRRLMESVTIVESKIICKEIGDISEDVIKRETRHYLKSYNSDANPILDAYNRLPRAVRVVDISQEETEIILTSQDMERINLIESFLDIAKNYIALDYMRLKDDGGSKCMGCGIAIEDIYVINDNCQTCHNCGVVRTGGTVSKVLEVSHDITTSKLYQDQVNFKKAFYRYMGLQKIKFDMIKVLNVIDINLQTKGHPPAAEIKAMPWDIRGKKEGTSLTILFDAMKECGYTNYEDGNRIAYELWGWKLPNLLYLEDIIMNDYKITQEIYSTIPINIRRRKSCLSTQFRLFKHLQLRGHDCDASDFKLPVQTESMQNHNELWQIMCEGASRFDPCIYYIPT